MKKIIQDSILYISNNFFNPLINDDISKSVNLSKFHFQRLFKEEVGLTPQKYIEWVRIEYAKHLIKIFPELKKSEIAYECGFNSPTSFNRAFKRQTNINPGEYNLNLEKLSDSLRNKINNKEKNNFEILYLEDKFFETKLITPIKENIESELALYQMNGNPKLIGIYLDAPIHTPIEKCRYLIGFEVKDKENSNQVLEKGYYIQFEFSGNWIELAKTASIILDNISKKKYKIKKLIAYEELNISKGININYEIMNRKLLIPLMK